MVYHRAVLEQIIEKLAIRRAGADQQHIDPVSHQLSPQRIAPTVHGKFARAVLTLQRHSPMSEDASDIDDDRLVSEFQKWQRNASQFHSAKEVNFKDIDTDENIAKISLVGAGMRSHPGVSATFFKAIADAGVNVEMISTSEIRISVVTRAEDAEKAVTAIHTAFGLDADGEAVVYGGTGR
jgi:aspartokinase